MASNDRYFSKQSRDFSSYNLRDLVGIQLTLIWPNLAILLLGMILKLSRAIPSWALGEMILRSSFFHSNVPALFRAARICLFSKSAMSPTWYFATRIPCVSKGSAFAFALEMCATWKMFLMFVIFTHPYHNGATWGWIWLYIVPCNPIVWSTFAIVYHPYTVVHLMVTKPTALW